MEENLKQLLLQDLCARLPYVVYFMVPEINEPVELLSINPKRDKPLEVDDGHGENSSTYWNLKDVKPCLRPMSSMTEEERIEWMGITHAQEWLIIGNLDKAIDWLNAHHFDHRGLIEKGVALEAHEDMYNIK